MHCHLSFRNNSFLKGFSQLWTAKLSTTMHGVARDRETLECLDRSIKITSSANRSSRQPKITHLESLGILLQNSESNYCCCHADFRWIKEPSLPLCCCPWHPYKQQQFISLSPTCKQIRTFHHLSSSSVQKHKFYPLSCSSTCHKNPSLRRWPHLPLVGSCWDRAAF